MAKATHRDQQLELFREITRLNAQLAAKKRELFGLSRSEKRGETESAPETASAPEVDSAPSVDGTPPAPTRPARRPQEPTKRGRTPQPRLPLVEHVHPLDEADQVCPCCGDGLRERKDQFETSEEVTFERTRYTTTLWDQLVLLYGLALPTLLALHEHLLTQPILHAEESPWRLMGRGRSRRWWVGSLSANQSVCDLLAPSRGQHAVRVLLKDFAGVLVVGGHGADRSRRVRNDDDPTDDDLGRQSRLAEALDDIAGLYRIAGGWMPARRPSFQAERQQPEAIFPPTSSLSSTPSSAKPRTKPTGKLPRALTGLLPFSPPAAPCAPNAP